MVKKIGCFITGAWTEAGAMSVFLRKINSEFEYIQCLPNKPKYKKELDPKISGLTGKALIDKVLCKVENYKNEYKDFSAIIIEDDLDCRFHDKSQKEIDSYKNKIQQMIWEKLETKIPIIFLFASPEIETWFICDWDNSFVHVYKDHFFCYHLKKYLNEKVIDGHWQTGIEHFGIKNGKYIKLSDSLQEAIATGVKDELRVLYTNKQVPVMAIHVIEDRSLYYSKRIHGDRMLRNIQPANFVEQCNAFFKPAFIELRDLGSLH